MTSRDRPRSCPVSRGSKYFETFRREVSPVETVLGESRGSGRRTERSDVFQTANYRHDSARGSGGLEIACPIPDQSLFCEHPAYNRTVCEIPFPGDRQRKELPFVNSLPTAFSRREHQLHLDFEQNNPRITRFLKETIGSGLKIGESSVSGSVGF